MVSQIKLALLGSGYWGTKLATEYIQLQEDNKNFNFFGIVDPDKTRLAKIQEKLNLSSSMLFDDVKECLNNSVLMLFMLRFLMICTLALHMRVYLKTNTFY